MSKNLFLLLAALVASALVPQARAGVWTEVGDAGSAGVGAAQVTAESAAQLNPLTAISGSLSSGADSDLYAIFIFDPAAFSASTVVASPLDSQLFLFNASGIGVLANDDSPLGGTTQSLLPSVAQGRPAGLGPTTPGLYYLGISAFDNDPTSTDPPLTTAEIFPSTPFTGVFGPTGPGGGSPLGSFETTFGPIAGGAYTINLTGANFAVAIPEPATVFLVAAGAAGVLGCHLRRRRVIA